MLRAKPAEVSTLQIYNDEVNAVLNWRRRVVPTVKGDLLEGKRISQRFRIKTVEKWTEHCVYCIAEDMAESQLVFLVLIDSHAIKDLASMRRDLAARCRIRHKNLSELIAFGDTVDGDLFIALRRFGCSWLNETLTKGALSVDDSVCVLNQIIDGLEHNRRAGMPPIFPLPQKIILDERRYNSFSHVKVSNLDFPNDSLSVEICLPELGSLKEKALYLAPECLKTRKIDERAQVYALGCLFYQLITGQLPFASDDLLELESQHLCMSPKRLHEVRPDLYFDPRIEALINKCLQKSPEKRYSTLMELKAELQAAISGRWFLGQRTLQVASLLGLAVMASACCLPTFYDSVLMNFKASPKKVVLPSEFTPVSKLSALEMGVAPVPQNAVRLGHLKLVGDESRTLTAGDYVCESIEIADNARLFAKDNVHLWIEDGEKSNPAIALKGNAVLASEAAAENFAIYDLSSSDITMLGKSKIRANVQAPAASLRATDDAAIEGQFVSNGQILSKHAHFVSLAED